MFWLPKPEQSIPVRVTLEPPRSLVLTSDGEPLLTATLSRKDVSNLFWSIELVHMMCERVKKKVIDAS